MADVRIWRNKVPETGTKYFRARLVDRNGNVMVQANYSGTVTVKVFDKHSDDADTAVYSNTALVLASVLTNTLQTWEADATGWNFEHGLTSNNVAWEGGHTYRVEYFLVHTSEGVHSVLFEAVPEGAIGA